MFPTAPTSCSSNAGTLKKFLDETNNYNHQFDGLVPKTKAFNEKWVALANSDPAFGKAQHDFIAASHYHKQMTKLKKEGFDFSERGKAIQDMVWSTAVQYGNAVNVVKRAEGESGLDFKTATDREIIEAVQDSKRRHVDRDFRSSSPKWRNNIKNNRIPTEKADLLKLDGYEKLIEEHENNKGKETSSQSKYDEVRAMLRGLANDTDGSYAKKVLADNPEEVARFHEVAKERIEQEKYQELAMQENKNIQYEELQRGFSRSV